MHADSIHGIVMNFALAEAPTKHSGPHRTSTKPQPQEPMHVQQDCHSNDQAYRKVHQVLLSPADASNWVSDSMLLRFAVFLVVLLSSGLGSSSRHGAAALPQAYESVSSIAAQGACSWFTWEQCCCSCSWDPCCCCP
jgi:hypothetical protein